MGKKLQVTVPDQIAAESREKAEVAGLSLSSWVLAQMSEAPNYARIMDRLECHTRKLKSHSSHLSAIADTVMKGQE